MTWYTPGYRMNMHGYWTSTTIWHFTSGFLGADDERDPERGQASHLRPPASQARTSCGFCAS